MRRAFTLVEILVALVIMAVIVSGVMGVFQYQNRNASVQRDVAEMNLMGKGMAEELSRTIRMAGGALPPSFGGLKVYGGGAEKVKVALNRNNGSDSTRLAANYYRGTIGSPWGGSYSNPYILPLNDVQGVFPDSGYVLTTVKIPAFGALAAGGPTRDTMIVMPILKVQPAATAWTVNGVAMTGPYVIADGSWFAAQWPFAGAAATGVSMPVYALDSVLYWTSNDTVYRKIDRNASAPYAIGVDSLKISYLHPSAGWLDSLSGADPANQIVKVRMRLRMRTRHADPVLKKSNPSSQGLHYQTIESEVSLRNASTLVNQ